MSTRPVLLFFVLALIVWLAIGFAGTGESNAEAPFSQFLNDLSAGVARDVRLDQKSSRVEWSVGGVKKETSTPPDAVEFIRASGTAFTESSLGRSWTHALASAAWGFAFIVAFGGMAIALLADAWTIEDRTSRITWVFALLLLGPVGVVAYLVTRKRLGRRFLIVASIIGVIAVAFGVLLGISDRRGFSSVTTQLPAATATKPPTRS